MNEYPINEKPCDFPDCESTDTTPCSLYRYQPDATGWWYLRTYGLVTGLKRLWQLWRHSYIKLPPIRLPPEYLCPEHAKEEGFCWGCGSFVAGGDNGFDLRGEWLCANCRPEPEYDGHRCRCYWEEGARDRGARVMRCVLCGVAYTVQSNRGCVEAAGGR